MNWIFRIIGFLILVLLRFLASLSGVVFRVFLLPIISIVVWLFRSLMLFSLTATVSGPRQFIGRLAGEWTERIYERSLTREHLSEVFQLCRVLVGTLIVFGWLVAGFFTFNILRVVFGFFT
jgi:hypothetical protein